MSTKPKTTLSDSLCASATPQTELKSTRQAKKSVNRGAEYARVKYNPREAAFAKAWEKENEPNAHINYGHGILQDLFSKPDPIFWMTIGGVATKVITDDERIVTATAIQWLGSNCGWCFLE